jgi:hypothetical protein
MRKSIGVVGAILLVGATNAAQQEEQRFIEPRESMLTAVAQQPGCPLQFTRADIYRDATGYLGIDYTVRNISQKPIRPFAVSANWGPQSRGQGFNPSNSAQEVVMPGDSYTWPAPEVYGSAEASLPQGLRKKFHSGPPLRGLAVSW